jgi:hypothetical protein
MSVDRDGQLVMLGHCDVGLGNNVVELWRYSSAQACIRCVRVTQRLPTCRHSSHLQRWVGGGPLTGRGMAAAAAWGGC